MMLRPHPAHRLFPCWTLNPRKLAGRDVAPRLDSHLPAAPWKLCGSFLLSCFFRPLISRSGFRAGGVICIGNSQATQGQEETYLRGWRSQNQSHRTQAGKQPDYQSINTLLMLNQTIGAGASWDRFPYSSISQMRKLETKRGLLISLGDTQLRKLVCWDGNPGNLTP